MFKLSLLTSPGALRALLLLSSLVALTAVSVACGPARGGGGGDDCESNEDCDDDEFCRFKDPDDEEGECRSLDTDNNAPVNNNPGFTADCGAICDKYAECGFIEAQERDACINACEDEGVISSSAQSCILTSTCEAIPSCAQPANNTNNPANNPVNNNPVPFTVQDCEDTCDRVLACPIFEACSGDVLAGSRSDCYSTCSEAIESIEPVSQSSCSEIEPQARSFVDLDQCGAQGSECQTACDYLEMCTEEFCAGATIEGCVDVCEGDPGSREQIISLQNTPCEQVQQLLCP